MINRPEYLSQGEPSRLFPVLATTSKEGRTTSILLACLSQIDEFGKLLFNSVGQKLGRRAKIQTYTEVAFKASQSTAKDQPDGLIVIRVGSREWRALVETKVGSNHLRNEQIERYRLLAKTHKIDCVITISNQFATNPNNHPMEEVRKSRSKIPVFHWSWMFILTTADLILNNNSVQDADQALLLNEFRRFLRHESAGVKGFERMPKEWSELNRLVSAGGKIPTRSSDALTVLEAWHQETRDLALILSRKTETSVSEKLQRKHSLDPALRLKDERAILVENNCLFANLEIPDAAALIQIVADITRRTVEVGMTLRSPEDKKSTKARINWLLRQVKSDKVSDLHIRIKWYGSSETSQFSFTDVLSDSSIVERENAGRVALSFHLLHAKRLGGRFTQQTNFIADLEQMVPEFYQDIGQNLSAWRKPPPKIPSEKPNSGIGSEEQISETAD